VRAPGPSAPAVTAVMRGNRSKYTRPERELRSALHRLCPRCRKNERPAPDVPFRADVVVAREHVAVAVDGCFWHACLEHGVQPRTNSEYWSGKIARNVARDRANDDAREAVGPRIPEPMRP
jgi:DNA mismatch endonuclease, patch repair protein